MLIRLALKLALILMALFTMAAGLIHAQPFNDGGLRTLVTPPDDCASPCWQGIRPGSTTWQEAVAFLDSNPWVLDGSTNVSADVLVTGLGFIRWRWNGLQPAALDAATPGAVFIDNYRVRQIIFATDARFGDVWLAFGTPDDSGGLNSVQASPRQTPVLHHQAVYQAGNLSIVGQPRCPLTPRSFWGTPISIIIRRPLRIERTAYEFPLMGSDSLC